MLEVPALGAEVRRKHMNWIHLPVRDHSIPNKAIEQDWQDLSEGIRATLRSGFLVVFHCRGGLGRAGTMAARTLVELGCFEPDQAIREVRRVRAGAIEADEQEGFVQRGQPVLETAPDVSPLAIEGAQTSLSAMRWFSLTMRIQAGWNFRKAQVWGPK
jgi:ADP-ribosyl-[dinitrogen reductase] hydrolase